MSEEANEPPTLEDVARRAGVNKVTASIALNGGRGNTRVSEATRQRILQAAEELQYRPNALARSLRRRQSQVIGFYMGGFLDTRNPFISEIISGLYLGCEENGRDFLMHGTFRGDSAESVIAELLNGKVDGMVLHVGSDHPLLPQLAASRLPVVALANPAPGIASVTVDDRRGSQLLVEHLAERGHRHILYLTSPHALTAAVRRHAAFVEAAEARGITVSTAVADLSGFSLKTDVSAVVCWNDETAYTVVELLRAQGLRVPQDVAVAGFDGWTSAIPPAYRLTTMSAPWSEVARTAVRLLATSTGKPAATDTVLPVSLFIGDTT